MESTKILDAKGLACPMPIVKTRKEMKELDAGQVLEVHATDKGSKADLTAWAASTGNKVVKEEEVNGVFKFWIKKG
ncbi:sulfurtransferase TusA family protein [Bacillus sp. B-jedd]|uniref:sulfurtransferase TusA family protein n=1 Tax=Bacillus sp. B-jedd TaxID=1476857 RepID=UPI0005155AE4|nr:sulfurtransferase TusA family protein [Bacillus sp. B-jedd]CEG25815.1 SirA family protein [Bacillus sp. B-jedd]